MNPIPPLTPDAAPLPPPFDALAALPLVETDGEPLETDWHRKAINLLCELIDYHYRDRDDFFVGGNMFIYFSAQQVRNRDYRGPDFFYVDGAERRRERLWWAIWDEGGRFPDVIIELLSPSTAEEDRTTKKAIYERTFRTREYYLYDPDTEELEGWRLNSRRRYRAIKPGEGDRLWSEELGLWVGRWDGVFQGDRRTWLRFFDPEGNPIPTYGEAAMREADDARQRVESAQAELARLREEIAALRAASRKPELPE